MTSTADDHDSIDLDTMWEHLSKYQGQIVAETIKAVFDAHGFSWRDDATRGAIARNLREIPPDTDVAAVIIRVICATYDERGFPHEPAAVRQAVMQRLGDA